MRWWTGLLPFFLVVRIARLSESVDQAGLRLYKGPGNWWVTCVKPLNWEDR
jgi:hypothetical protein